MMDFEPGEILYYPVIEHGKPAAQRCRFLRPSRSRRHWMIVDRGGFEEMVSIHLIYKHIMGAMRRAEEMMRP